MQSIKLLLNSKLLLIIALSSFLCSGIQSQEEILTLSNGKKIIIHPDKTWDYHEGISYDFNFSTLKDDQIPNFLRQGIRANKRTLTTAAELYLQGWRYTMPGPKSNQAAWGNYDGRTTLWKGHWYNNKTNKYSRSTPLKQSNGYYYGDNQNDKGNWSNGGSPGMPSKIEWLLSSYGGVKP